MASQPPDPPRIKRRVAPTILLAVLTAFAATMGVYAALGGVANAAGNPQVTYQLSGSSPVAEYISYQTDTGQYHQANVPLPWTTKFQAFDRQVFVFSAQGPGSITCTILLDDKMVSQATANGQPARTVCSH